MMIRANSLILSCLLLGAKVLMLPGWPFHSYIGYCWVSLCQMCVCNECVWTYILCLCAMNVCGHTFCACVMCFFKCVVSFCFRNHLDLLKKDNQLILELRNLDQAHR